jgi:hypothetical protein
LQLAINATLDKFGVIELGGSKGRICDFLFNSGQKSDGVDTKLVINHNALVFAFKVLVNPGASALCRQKNSGHFRIVFLVVPQKVLL